MAWKQPFPGEDRLLVPSPKVATYDLQPEMSAAGVTDALVEAIESDTYDFIVANYANPDMVGHSGVWDATVQALRVPRRMSSARVIGPRAADDASAQARCCASPPTTATPTRCATPMATP